MALRRRRTWLWRSVATLAVAAILLLYLACLPFYSGSALPLGLSWRLETGRLNLKRSPVGSTETFYVAVNSESMRFKPEFRVWSPSDWSLTIPLWMPLLLALAAAAWAWRPTTSGPRVPKCGTCGYPREGLGAGAMCPECGRSPP